MQFAVFSQQRLLCRGSLHEIVPLVHAQAVDPANQLIFIQEESGRTVDLDWRGTPKEVLERSQTQLGPKKAGPGRPKLGVQSREITLLPRHWAWLDAQRGSRSAVLRKLVEREMKGGGAVRVDALYGALSTLAGDLPGFEEATRALFALDWEGFAEQCLPWPESLRNYFIARVDEMRE